MSSGGVEILAQLQWGRVLMNAETYSASESPSDPIRVGRCFNGAAFS